MKIRIATRESRLAMWQAEHVKQKLMALNGVSEVIIVGMTTQGDQILDRSLSKIGGKGLFIKELETALLEDRADLAVHSGKDIPMQLQSQFNLVGFMTREDPSDAFVSNEYSHLDQLPPGAVVGTSSLRRQAQILAKYPYLIIKPLRGNLDTRLSKLDAGQFQAIVLASAGLKRLHLEHRIRCQLAPEVMLPAVGQGALGLEIRQQDSALKQLLLPLINPIETLLVQAERQISAALGGSCHVPIAGYAQLEAGNQMVLRGLVAHTNGTRILFAQARGPLDQWQQVSNQVIDELKAAGAEQLVEQSLNPHA